MQLLHQSKFNIGVILIKLLERDKENLYILFTVIFVIIFAVVSINFVTYRDSQIQIEAIKAGLQQDSEGHWIK